MCKMVYSSHFSVCHSSYFEDDVKVQNRKLGNKLRLLNVTLFGYFEEKASKLRHVRICHLSDNKSKVHLNKEIPDYSMRKTFLVRAVVYIASQSIR